MRATEFLKEDELSYILNMRAGEHHPDFPTENWINLLECSANTTCLLKEDVDPKTIERLSKLKSLGSPPIIGKKYIPVEIILVNNGIHIMINGDFPHKSPAKFLTLDRIAPNSMTFNNRELQTNYLSKVVYTDVILMDSIESYEKIRLWVKMAFDISLPEVEA